MIADILLSAINVTELLGFAIVLALGLYGLSFLIRWLARKRTWLQRAYRYYPAFCLAVALVFLPGALVGFYSMEDFQIWLAVLLVLAFLGRDMVRDVLAGIWLRAEGALESGGRITVGGATGRIGRLFLRSFELETDDGASVRIAYGNASRKAIRRLAGQQSRAGHTFRVPVAGASRSTESVRQHILLLVLNHAFVALPAGTNAGPTVRPISVSDDRVEFEVSVRTIAPEQVLELERFVTEACRNMK